MDEEDFTPELAEDIEPAFDDSANAESDWDGASEEIAAAAIRPENSFRPGDRVKFQATAALKDGHAFLPPLRERVFLMVNIVERNGTQLSKPVPLECGLYLDKLPSGMKMWWEGDILRMDGLDTDRYWTGTLDSGLGRIKTENAGTWVEMTEQPFIDSPTLAMAEEPVPPALQDPQQPHPQPAAR